MKTQDNKEAESKALATLVGSLSLGGIGLHITFPESPTGLTSMTVLLGGYSTT